MYSVITNLPMKLALLTCLLGALLAAGSCEGLTTETTTTLPETDDPPAIYEKSMEASTETPLSAQETTLADFTTLRSSGAEVIESNKTTIEAKSESTTVVPLETSSQFQSSLRPRPTSSRWTMATEAIGSTVGSVSTSGYYSNGGVSSSTLRSDYNDNMVLVSSTLGPISSYPVRYVTKTPQVVLASTYETQDATLSTRLPVTTKPPRVVLASTYQPHEPQAATEFTKLSSVAPSTAEPLRIESKPTRPSEIVLPSLLQDMFKYPQDEVASTKSPESLLSSTKPPQVMTKRPQVVTRRPQFVTRRPEIVEASSEHHQAILSSGEHLTKFTSTHKSEVSTQGPKPVTLPILQHVNKNKVTGTDIRRKGSGGGVKVKRKKYKDHGMSSLVYIPIMLQAQIIPMMLFNLKFMALKALALGKMALILLGLNLLRNAVIGHQNVDDQYEHDTLASQHYGYNGGPEYGSWVNRRTHSSDESNSKDRRYYRRFKASQNKSGITTESGRENISGYYSNQYNRRPSVYNPKVNKKEDSENYPYRAYST